MRRVRRVLPSRLGAALFLVAALIGADRVTGEVPELPPAGPLLEPPRAMAASELDWALRALQTHCRLLVVAAHPDDEDTAALVATVRGQGGEAAYLSLTRGEGGQNRLGPELGQALGLIRTGELQAARRVDGARQFFARALDFGYTRSREESLMRWGAEEVLADTVQVVRRFRPRIVLSVFGDDPGSGHGHHQAAGFLAPRAVQAAEDPSYRPDLGPPWRVEALYRSSWFQPEGADHGVALGTLEPFTGFSLAQLASLSRSQHRSQDMGRALELGSRSGKFRKVSGLPAVAGSLCGTGGLELSRLADLAPLEARAPLSKRLEELANRARRLREENLSGNIFSRLDDVDKLLSLWEALARDVRSVNPALAALVEEKRGWAAILWLGVRRVVFDAWVDRAELPPEGSARLEVVAWNAGPSPLVLEGWDLLAISGIEADLPTGPWSLAPGELLRRQMELRFDGTVEPTRPYFLKRPQVGDRYSWDGVEPEIQGLPDAPGPIRVRWRLQGPAGPLELVRTVVERQVDEGLGELRRPVRVLPAVDVGLGPEPLFHRNGQDARVVVQLRSYLSRPIEGTLVLSSDCPGWVEQRRLIQLGGNAQIRHEVRIPPCSSRHAVTARFEAEQRAWMERLVAVPGALRPPHVLPLPATVAAVRLEVVWPQVGRVVYIPGASDRVPEALQRAGLEVDVRSARELGAEALEGYRIAVVGSRAYEVDPELAQLTPHLLEWVRQGGLLLMLYQQYGYFSKNFAPFLIEMGRPHGRITDEQSAVQQLVANHPVFREPNRITEADWVGWVQERALYLPKSWDPRYQPLVELQDPGEPPERGALLLARYGKGTFVYTGLAFFRQLPAGVPGAFRLFANLLALGTDSGEDRR